MLLNYFLTKRVDYDCLKQDFINISRDKFYSELGVEPWTSRFLD